MPGQLIALWVISLADLLILGLVVTRSGGLVGLFRWNRNKPLAAGELINKKLPALHAASGPVGSGGTGARTVVFEEGTMIVLVTAPCVASYRLLRSLTGKLSGHPATFPVVFAIVGTGDNTGRLLQQFSMDGQSIVITDRRFSFRIADALPMVITAGRNNLVSHAGSIEGDEEFEAFVAACGYQVIRNWYASATGPSQPMPEERVRVRQV